MNTSRILSFVGALLLVSVATGCSAPAANDLQSDGNGTDESTEETAKKPTTTRASETSTKETETPPAKPAPEPAQEDPEPTEPETLACEKLSACCGSLKDLGDKLACMAASLAKKEAVCSATLVICQGGGVGISDLFTKKP